MARSENSIQMRNMLGLNQIQITVQKVKLPVESGELAVFAWYSYHRHCDVNAPVQTSARVIITRNHSTNTTRQQFPLDLHTG